MDKWEIMGIRMMKGMGKIAQGLGMIAETISSMDEKDKREFLKELND